MVSLFYSIPKIKLRVGTTSRYLTGILITYIATTSILFMSHMHAFLDLKLWSQSLVNLGDFLAGQSRTIISAMDTDTDVLPRIFQNFLYDYYSAHLDLQLLYSNFFLKKLFSYIYINAAPLLGKEAAQWDGHGSVLVSSLSNYPLPTFKTTGDFCSRGAGLCMGPYYLLVGQTTGSPWWPSKPPYLCGT